MSDIVLKNEYGEIHLGDYVMISPKVSTTDLLRTYVDIKHPILKLKRIGTGNATLESWDGRGIGIYDWAIMPIAGLSGCQLCKYMCKNKEPCELFRSIMETK